MQPSVGGVGSALDNALAESVIGLYKTELIKPRGPWRDVEDVEVATLGYVDWFNFRRLYEVNGDLPPVELEQAYHRRHRVTVAVGQPAAPPVGWDGLGDPAGRHRLPAPCLQGPQRLASQGWRAAPSPQATPKAPLTGEERPHTLAQPIPADPPTQPPFPTN